MTYYNWDQVEFQTIFSIPLRNGLTKPSRVRGNGVPMINMKELFQFDRLINPKMELVPVNESELINNKIEIHDLLFARQSLVASGAGKCSLVIKVPKNTVFESHLIRVRLNHVKAYSPFYYYYFKSPIGRGKIEALVEQVAAAGIRGSDLRKISIDLPSINTQKAIANILSSLDEKIELNNKINKNLETLAQTLYKQWFVDFEFPNDDGEPYKSSGGEMVESELGLIPKGWEVESIGESSISKLISSGIKEFNGTVSI